MMLLRIRLGIVMLLLWYILFAALVFDFSAPSLAFDHELVVYGPEVRWYACINYYNGHFDGGEWVFYFFNPICRLWAYFNGFSMASSNAPIHGWPYGSEWLYGSMLLSLASAYYCTFFSKQIGGKHLSQHLILTTFLVGLTCSLFSVSDYGTIKSIAILLCPVALTFLTSYRSY
jgi:hypothetical protein